MPPGNEEDFALAQRSAAGDTTAFALLVEKHERPLRAFLERLAGADGDDLAQQAFLKAWRSAGQYDGRARFSTWLTRIAWRCRLDQLRRRQPEPVEPPVAVDHHRPLEVADLLARLGERERAALILCEGHGWTHGEAATLLAIPLGTLKSTIARAKRQCRQVWEASDD
ncbi:RNA polymerase sigma factor [Sphingomonas mesophila]|uniref:RNA polymerase sigma factor n=1 Tax=Sphingomonas mesophila TaxID=2303576 RepID=UPI0013C3739A|nr:RNA polymerase sigma factor [Sphingomonas mesophila]